MNRSESINELAAGLAKAQGEIMPAKFDATNPHFRSKYATLSSIQDACRDALAKNGISVVQGVQDKDGALVLETMLIHSSGQWISSYMSIEVDSSTKNKMQALGSSITYARRYSLAAMVGVVADEDDDANAASSAAPAKRQAPSAPAASPKAPPQGKEKKKPANLAPLSDQEFAKKYMGSPTAAGEYVCTFGKFQGQQVQDIGDIELDGYMEFIYQQAEKEGKTPSGAVKQFLMAAEFYLSDR